jgi:hypothetical protein
MRASVDGDGLGSRLMYTWFYVIKGGLIRSMESKE